MKKILLCLFLAACSPAKDTLSIVNGAPGADGKDGLDGVSCTVAAHELGALLLCSDGSEVLVLNGLNGANGADGSDGLNGADGQDGANGQDGADGQDGAVGATGPQGPQGPAGAAGSTVTLTSYALSGCTALTGTLFYAKKDGSNRAFYTSASCHSSTKEYEMSEGHAFWVSSSKLAVYTDTGIRVINF